MVEIYQAFIEKSAKRLVGEVLFIKAANMCIYINIIHMYICSFMLVFMHVSVFVHLKWASRTTLK